MRLYFRPLGFMTLDIELVFLAADEFQDSARQQIRRLIKILDGVYGFVFM